MRNIKPKPAFRCGFGAEGAEPWCIISDYTKAKLPKCSELCKEPRVYYRNSPAEAGLKRKEKKWGKRGVIYPRG